MKLSIIIPVYEEPTETILRAVNSIKAQLMYTPEDIEVIVSSDMPGRKLAIENVRFVETSENKGPGVARQRGLDICCGDYVSFLDADDIWYNALAYVLFLKDVYQQPDAPIDIAKFPILEQSDQGGFSQIAHDSTWCFSKFYRRKFLNDNNIRFRDDLRVHEDSWFVRYAELHSPRMLNHGDMIYLWSHNPVSTVRRNNGEYWQNSFDSYLNVIYGIQAEKAARGHDIQGDSLYNFAYAFANICRMDDAYRDKCLKTMRVYLTEKETVAIVAQGVALAASVKAVESQPNLPHILPKITITQFSEMLKEVDG